MALIFVLSALALYVSVWFVLPFFAVIGFSPILLNKTTCPNCGTPVTYQGSILGFRIRGGFIRRRCQQCGWDLRKIK